MPKIRTTMRPDLEIEVPDADYVDLQRQGLLVGTDETPSAPDPGPAPKKTAAAPQASGTTKEG